MFGIFASFKKRLDVHFQNVRNLKKAPTSNSICAFFIFLYLLKCDADIASEVCLRKPFCKAAQMDISTNKFVNCILGFPRHSCSNSSMLLELL